MERLWMRSRRIQPQMWDIWLGCADVLEVEEGTFVDVLDVKLRVAGGFEDDPWLADLGRWAQSSWYLLSPSHRRSLGHLIPLVLTRKVEFSSGCLENVLKKQTKAQILYSALEAPLAALTASSLQGHDSISLNLGIFCGSSLQSHCLSGWTVTARLRTFQNTTVLITYSETGFIRLP